MHPAKSEKGVIIPIAKATTLLCTQTMIWRRINLKMKAKLILPSSLVVSIFFVCRQIMDSHSTKIWRNESWHLKTIATKAFSRSIEIVKRKVRWFVHVVTAKGTLTTLSYRVTLKGKDNEEGQQDSGWTMLLLLLCIYQAPYLGVKTCSEALTRHLLQNKVNIKISNYAAANNITKKLNISNIKQNHVSGSRKQESHK